MNSVFCDMVYGFLKRRSAFHSGECFNFAALMVSRPPSSGPIPHLWCLITVQWPTFSRCSSTAVGAALVRFAKSCGLIRGEWIAIDGSKFRAVASIDAVRERVALRRCLDGLEKADTVRETKIDRSAAKAALEKLKQTGEPEASFMLTRQQALPAYNIQTDVDTKPALIVAHAYTRPIICGAPMGVCRVHVVQTFLTLIAMSKRRMTSGIRARFPQCATARLPVVAPTRKLPQMIAKIRDLPRAVFLAAVNSQSNRPALSVLRLPVVTVEV